MTPLECELLRVVPDAQPVVIGQHAGYRYDTVTPAHTFNSFIKVIDAERALQLIARDSFSEPLARFLLDTSAGLDLSKLAPDGVGVFPAGLPSPWRFETVVVAPPGVAQRFKHESPLLTGAMFWVFPAFASEFKDGDNAAKFRHNLYRKDGWRVHILDWNRELKTSPEWT